MRVYEASKATFRGVLMAPYPLGSDSDVQGYQPEDADQDRGLKGNRGVSFLLNCPECPEIKKKIDRIFVALLGDDGLGMQNGLVYELTLLKSNKITTASWVGVVKPIAIAVISSAITFGLTYGILERIL
jgi:hypothetical protein